MGCSCWRCSFFFMLHRVIFLTLICAVVVVVVVIVVVVTTTAAATCDVLFAVLLYVALPHNLFVSRQFRCTTIRTSRV